MSNIADKLAGDCSVKCTPTAVKDLIDRLRKRAEIRRSIRTRRSVQFGETDRIADLLEEAANALEYSTSWWASND